METKELKEKIQQLLNQKERVIIAIEGGSASGKTTLGKELEQDFGCQVLHMDDFFLRPEQRTKERLEEPGGNVDRERFYEEVVIPLQKGKPMEYRPFDCGTFTIQPSKRIVPGNLVVVEGAYSTHPELGRYYDWSVFMDIEPELQRERILKRNGSEKAGLFFERWIPMEEKYFEVMNVKERCNMILPVSGGRKK